MSSVLQNVRPSRICDLFLRKDDHTPDVRLKKTNFCERVRLTRSEWEGGFQEIYLYLGSEELVAGKAIMI